MREKGTALAIVCCLIVIFMVAASGAAGQGAATSSLSGRVTDQSGAVVPGAKVTVRNVDTNTARSVETNEFGDYRALLLQPGNYEVTVEVAGFTTFRRSGIQLEVGNAATVNVALSVAGSEQVVTVTEDAPVVDVEKQGYTATVSQVSVENLPINGRRWENFVLLTPTVAPDGDFGLVSYRGISGLYNNNMVDGADNNQAFFSEARGRTRTSYTVSLASIKEFQVGVSNFSAEFGRAAGGTVNAITKSGSNTFHGEAFYFIRDAALNAAEPISNAQGFQKQDDRRQQYGLNFGGPLMQDKLFYFLSYDEQHRNFPGIAVSTRDVTDSMGRLFIDPNFDVSSICSVTTVGLARCEGARQVLLAELGPFDRKGLNNVALGKLDYHLNEQHTIGGQYNWHKWRSPNGIQTQDRTNDTPLANGFDGVRTDLLLVRWTAIPGATTVNSFRFQFGRDLNFQLPNAPGPSVTHNSQLDIDGGGMRDFLPRPQFPNEKRFQFTDNFSWVRGNHVWKFGGDINYVRELEVNLFRGGGVFDYRSFEAFAKDVPLAGIAPFIDSNPANTGKHYQTFTQAFALTGGTAIPRIFFTTTDWNFYVADTWKITPTVTLTSGLRYEYTDLPQPPQSIFQSPTADFLSLPSNLQQQAMQINQDSNNLGPRLSLAWDVRGSQRTVVRAGYGMYYGRTSNSALARGLFENNAISTQEILLDGNRNQSSRTADAAAPVFPNTFCTPALGTPGQQSTCTPPAGVTGSSQFSAFSPDFVRPLIHMAELEVQQAISTNMSVSISYLMSRGLHLPVFNDINFNPPNGVDTVTYVDASSGTILGGPFNFYDGPRPVLTFGQILEAQSTATSWYHAMVLRFQRRLSGGLQFDTHYTWSKALDDGQNSFTFFATFPHLFDPFDRSADYGPSDFDIRHKFVSNFYWDPPFERIGNTAVRNLLDGFLFSGILTARGGRALSIDLDGSVPRSLGGATFFTTNGTGGGSRVPWIGRNSGFGTNFVSFDFRVTREFRVTEGSRLVLAWEAFNLLNKTNFTGYDTDAFEEVGARLCSATVTTNCMAAASDSARFLNIDTLSGFPNPTAASNTLSGPREMQLAVKFRW